MSWYGLARPLLFSLDPETAHQVGLRLAGWVVPRKLQFPVRAMGLEFANPVGLAAGLDKDAAHIDALARMGFGFIEVGTVTPRPQSGNAKPRLFRLPQANALINRFGFNNVGVDAFLENVARSRWRGVLGINIGKNADTPVERAAEDYELCLQKVYPAASYVTINVSSPNTAGLRSLQERDSLEDLLARLNSSREKLSDRHGKRVPLVLKIAPELAPEDIPSIAASVQRHAIDGVIATNTSLSRQGVENLPHASEAGGLSGAPIRDRATRVLKEFSLSLPETTLIGAGGILSAADATEKRAAGATLVQLYTGLIYRGPGLVAECVSAYRAK
ncbi:MAG TPA: quinone-dependent dihydroorotate dehydrogenase [Burkholderiales bacterium]|nr:quinone-dependent dihydroorotate dehydrogenase [Burkholderiales bacterium]